MFSRTEKVEEWMRSEVEKAVKKDKVGRPEEEVHDPFANREEESNPEFVTANEIKETKQMIAECNKITNNGVSNFLKSFFQDHATASGILDDAWLK